LELVWNGGEQRNRLPPQDAYPDYDTLQAWENMRIEILHELQDGGSTDVPDADVDQLGTLVPGHQLAGSADDSMLLCSHDVD
jgi:hypothetical protein